MFRNIVKDPQRTGQPLPLSPILHGGGRLVEVMGTFAWLVAAILFWSWWLRPEHIGNPWAFAFATASLLWLTLSPAYFLAIFARSRRVPAEFEPPRGLRVAMVVTKVPNEPFAMVKATLRAMLAQRYPHDTWLADEDPTPEVVEWARKHMVKISTRRGHPEYNRPEWPRRAKTKEGNLAYFYDTYGYRDYDVVVQMDADHVPTRGYLATMLKPFADPMVGYVSAPSICDRNADESWSARGRLYAEASMHGSLQAGYNGGWAPLCIGSHYAVRTSALRQIGGLGPELAEDHSTTLTMNSFGWRGVHAVDAIAHGYGPDTFADLATQEFQWSRSLNTILLRYSPRLLTPLPVRLKLEFLYGQLWYSLFSVFMAFSVVMPLAALIFDFSFARVSYIDFLVHITPMSLILILLAYNWKASGSFRPATAPVISWESTIFQIVRWPWALYGALAALYGWATRKTLAFRVTPKRAAIVGDVPFLVLLPYLAISLMSTLVIMLVPRASAASGYYYFAAVNAVIYAIVAALIVVLHRRENHIRWTWSPGDLGRRVGLLLLTTLPVVVAEPHSLQALEALTWNSPYIRLTEAIYSVAGAGLGEPGERQLRFRIQWLPGQR